MSQENNSTSRILIADDEVEFASTLATRLELRGYDTDIASSGEQTLEAISRQVPDLLLLDLKMPDLDGLEVLAKLRENNEDLKVIILTGHGSFSAGNQGMALGAFDYIMKPVELSLLLEKIAEATA
ncbi:response regulator [Desulforhopalus sp. 52FAK]